MPSSRYNRDQLCSPISCCITAAGKALHLWSIPFTFFRRQLLECFSRFMVKIFQLCIGSASMHYVSRTNRVCSGWSRDCTNLLSLFFHRRYGKHVSNNSYYFCYDRPQIGKMFDRIRKMPNTGHYPAACGRFKIVNIRDLTVGYDSSFPDNKAVSFNLIYLKRTRINNYNVHYALHLKLKLHSGFIHSWFLYIIELCASLCRNSSKWIFFGAINSFPGPDSLVVCIIASACDAIQNRYPLQSALIDIQSCYHLLSQSVFWCPMTSHNGLDVRVTC